MYDTGKRQAVDQRAHHQGCHVVPLHSTESRVSGHQSICGEGLSLPYPGQLRGSRSAAQGHCRSSARVGQAGFGWGFLAVATVEGCLGVANVI